MIFIIFLSSLLGLTVSLYLFIRKSQKKKLFCPLRAQCDRVVHSVYARTGGIPNEVIGILFYGVLSLFSLLVLFYPELWISSVHYGALIMTSISVLFTLYLIVLQAFVIRAWCSWCLLSALAQLGLFVGLWGMSLSGVEYLALSHRSWWIILHTLGFVIGLGAVTMTDIFFFRFLKDNKISFEEKGTLDTLTHVIWIGLGMLIVSGIFLVLGDSGRLLASSKFLLKTIVVGVIVLNGIVLNFYLSPRLQYLTLEGKTHNRTLRKVAFALGGISIFSWYTAFFLGSFQSIPVSLGYGVLIYGVMLVGTIVISQGIERHFNNKTP